MFFWGKKTENLYLSFVLKKRKKEDDEEEEKNTRELCKKNGVTMAVWCILGDKVTTQFIVSLTQYFQYDTKH